MGIQIQRDRFMYVATDSPERAAELAGLSTAIPKKRQDSLGSTIYGVYDGPSQCDRCERTQGLRINSNGDILCPACDSDD